MYIKIDVIKEIRKRMSRIEERNSDYINSPKWKHYKQMEDNLYNEINFEKN